MSELFERVVCGVDPTDAGAAAPRVAALVTPPEELHLLSEESDLVVVGSRSLRGIRSLGSVSERVAHESLCSVLVVRQGKEKESWTSET
ncbi:MAG: universal stress protein [Gaiellaceae bacterium]